MAGEPQFTIGAGASCTDGHCGQVRRRTFAEDVVPDLFPGQLVVTVLHVRTPGQDPRPEGGETQDAVWRFCHASTQRPGWTRPRVTG
jgi:hypothetical protein